MFCKTKRSDQNPQLLYEEGYRCTPMGIGQMQIKKLIVKYHDICYQEDVG